MAIIPYPLANADATPIPFDVLNPASSVILPVATTAMTQALNLGVTSQGIMQVYAIGDYVQLGFGQTPIGPPPVGTITQNTLLILPNVVYAVAIIDPYISAVSLHQEANLFINILDGWHAAGVSKQYGSI